MCKHAVDSMDPVAICQLAAIFVVKIPLGYTVCNRSEKYFYVVQVGFINSSTVANVTYRVVPAEGVVYCANVDVEICGGAFPFRWDAERKKIIFCPELS